MSDQLAWFITLMVILTPAWIITAAAILSPLTDRIGDRFRDRPHTCRYHLGCITCGRSYERHEPCLCQDFQQMCAICGMRKP